MEFVGIQKESHFCRLAYLSKVRGEIVIQCLEKEQPSPEIKKNLSTVTGIEGQDLLVRHLISPLKKSRALKKTLPFQLEPLIPYSLDEVIIKPLFYIGDDKTEAQFFCVPKKALEKHLQSFQQFGIDPDWVTTVPSALARFVTFVAPDESSLIVFHIGMRKIQLISIHDHKLFSHVTLHIGAKDLSDGDSAKIVEKLKREVDRALCFMDHKEVVSGKRKVLFCGEKAKEVEVLLEGEDFLLAPIEIEGHRGFSGESVRPYAVPIGLALDALINDSTSIQLRQEDYIPKRTYANLKKGLVQGGVLAGMLFLLALTFSTLLYSKKEANLIEEISDLMTYYESGIPSLNGGIKGKHLEEVLTDLNRKLRVPKNGEHLYQSPPLIADLLAFISTHPQLEGIDVKRLDYTLTRYPTIKNPSDSYRPKVHLIFTTPEAKRARAFHDALIDDEQFVDGNGEIEWKRNEDEYEIAFFLRT